MNNEKLREILYKLYDFPDRPEPMTPRRLARALGYTCEWDVRCTCQIIKELAKEGIFIDTGKRESSGYGGRKDIVYLFNTNDNRLLLDIFVINSDMLARRLAKRLLNGEHDLKFTNKV